MKRLGIAIGASALIVSFFLFYPFYHVLQISNFKNGKIIFSIRMDKGEEFILSFTHSVNKRPVHDTIRIEGDHLKVIKSRFDSFGAGMPETSSDGSKLKIGKDGLFECMVNLPLKELTFFLGWIANHSLCLRGKNINLSDLIEPGTLISLRVRKISFFELWKGRYME